jgi:hypothetical protein
MSLLTAAGENAINKWKSRPIGGEIRPEIWGQIFDANPLHNQAQDFAECVRQTHATWLLDSGMFNQQPSADRIQRATSQIQQMGYNFHVQSARIDRTHPERLEVELSVLNNGVAPFYHRWPLELAALSATGEIVKTYPVDWMLTAIQPSAKPYTWAASLSVNAIAAQGEKLALRAINPLPTGKQLKFANASQDADAPGWLTLGVIPK